MPTGPLTAGEGGTAVPSRDGWALRGVVRRVPWGRYAGHVAVLAVSESGPVAALLAAGEYRVSPGHDLAGEPRDTPDLPGVVVPRDRASVVPAETSERLRLRGALGRVLLMPGAAEHALELTAATRVSASSSAAPSHGSRPCSTRSPGSPRRRPRCGPPPAPRYAPYERNPSTGGPSPRPRYARAAEIGAWLTRSRSGALRTALTDNRTPGE